ncbi:SURF1 family protein [Variibacter gotjawalensis]|uniref:SURF1-like protein n=1 Tax=Variibacter gotjawalensis TaxID=1333996 RepID=A0A0S3PS54_9BRAD|nr:SURF1 family protein [Variibacter gotjawalensis]NIK49077.1 surfeit locus 1 family protein [Variibacter gotjawalensis]RZS50933.1 surfeit locus 1 family protein [Variibacter gotjawalensis]BAT58767.1 SURF1 family protein [Variibacter gotjawalensis]
MRKQRRGGLLIPALAAIVALAACLALGNWQLERKAWKEGLIAALQERLAAPAAQLPSRSMWRDLNAQAAEFKRVTFPAEFLHDKEALVYASPSALRPDVSGPGYWVITPAQLPGGSIIMVNRGFVPEAAKDPAQRSPGQTKGIVDLTGVMRWPEPRGTFTPADDPAHNIWFLRDHFAIAAAKGVDLTAPFYIDLESPTPAGGVPKAGTLTVSLPNKHLEYALTWFGLAGVIVVMFAAFAFMRRRG